MPKFDSKKALIILGVIVVLGAAFYFLYQTNPTLFMNKEAERVWRSNQEQQIASLIRAGNFDACASVDYKSSDGVDYKAVCQNNIALNKATQSSDISWCKRLDNKNFKVDDCEKNIIFTSIRAGSGIEICNNSSEEVKNNCYSFYWTEQAKQKGNINLCRNIEKIGDQPFCRDNYWIELLIKDSQRISCANFTSASLQNDCKALKSVFDKNSLQTTKNICINIKNQDIRNICEKN